MILMSDLFHISEADASGVAVVVSGGRSHQLVLQVFARKKQLRLELGLFSSHLFFFKDQQRDAAAAFSFLLPLQELFGSASSFPTSRSRSWFGIIGHQPLVLDSPVTSHCALPAISRRRLPPPQSQSAFFFVFAVRINKWKLLFSPCLAAVRRCSWSPVACYILLSALHFLLLRLGSPVAGGSIRSHSIITSFLLACMADRQL